MEAAKKLLIEEGGKITLPDDLRSRYGLEDHTPVRIIETRGGILLVPLTDEPMSDALSKELQEWQSLGMLTLESFPYDEETPS